MKKRIISLVLSLIPLLANAYDAEVGGVYYNLEPDTIVAEVTSGDKKYTGGMTIPEKITYNGVEYSVTSIGDSAFSNCTGLTSVTIPNSVTSIGSNAFWYCTGLTSVNIPNSVTSIGDSAFSNCTGLTSVTIPNSVTSIGNSAFWYCSGLTSVNIPNSVRSIGDSAFRLCCGLTSVTIPNSVTSIGKRVFQECYGLTSVTIPNSVTSIEESAFVECTSLTSVEIPNSVTSIGNRSFYDCSSLTSVTIPNSVTSIGSSAFSGCSGLTSVEIPNSVTSIGGTTFYQCSSLTSVTIPNSVTSIGGGAFWDCSSLTSVTIPNSVRSIGNGAFEGCTGLTSVTIPNSVTSIGESVFSGCTGLTSVTIPNSVIGIGYGAFSGCRGLTSVNIPNSVTSIGEWAFNYCTGLTSVNIPNSVTSIEGWAFYNCTGLKKVIVKDIAAWCGISFDMDSSNPLYYAHHLYSDEDTEITDLVIPNSVTTIGNYAFYGCSSLTSVTIPNSVTRIGSSAFSVCKGLTSVTIPNSVTNIGSSAFSVCKGLTSVTIPNSVRSIGSEAFASCSKIEEMYCYAEKVPRINNNAFQYVNLLNSTLYVPATSIETYKTTIPWSDFGSIIGIIIQSTYRVEHYQLNIDGSIPKSPTETESKTGQSGEQTDAIAKTYEGFTPGAVVQTTILSDGSTVVKIYYTRNTFSITFDSDGGSEVPAINLVYGASVKAPTDPVRTGYTFVEWTPALPETMPAENLTFKAKWTINKYKLTYTVDGSTYKSYDVEYNSTITPEKEPSKEGYTFSGWSWIPSKMPAENVTVIGSFTVNKYKVTYVIGTEEFRVDMVEYGTTIVPPDAPERNGYTFAWADVPNVMPAHDITITGTYTSGIDNHEVEDNNNKIYNLRGVQTPTLVKGINILRYKNGKTVKVIKK